MAGFTAGQVVVLVPSENQRGSTPTEVTISRVGRKYAYVEQYRREIPFDIETGNERTDYPGSAQSIRTPERHARIVRQQAATERLRELDVIPNRSSRFIHSVEKLEAMVALLEGPEPV
jgi:hypothetical protein